MRVTANITLPVQSGNQAVKDAILGTLAQSAQHRSPQQLPPATPQDQ